MRLEIDYAAEHLNDDSVWYGTCIVTDDDFLYIDVRNIEKLYQLIQEEVCKKADEKYIKILRAIFIEDIK